MVNSLLIALTLCVLSTSCISEIVVPEAKDPHANDSFSFPEPSNNDLNQKLILWSTFYYLPQLKDGSGTYALRDMSGSELGPRLTLRGWCDSAMEGSTRIILKDGSAKTYNYAGVSDAEKVDCSGIFRINVSRTKFREANGPYGDGILDYILVPYRTLATDLTKIIPGTVLYVPDARGAKIVTPSGRVIIHDGYFFAGDKGGAIKGNQVDVYIGTSTAAPFFPWIKSTANKTFNAYVVNDQKVIDELSALHLLK